MADINSVNPLPPGWDAKYDSVTGKRWAKYKRRVFTIIDNPCSS